MSDDVSLANCIVSYDSTTQPPVPGGGGTFIVIPNVTATGAIGLMSEAKEKTNLSDTSKQYGAGMQDAPDKSLKGQVIPYENGGPYATEYSAQQVFFASCRAKTGMVIKVEWPDGEVNEFEFKPLGFETDEPNQEEWRMFTVNGKQNGEVDVVLPTP
tara:strand:- start:104 stop:574 length:471 start_codon:yes stop_codon:yes gene_type:complete